MALKHNVYACVCSTWCRERKGRKEANDEPTYEPTSPFTSLFLSSLSLPFAPYTHTHYKRYTLSVISLSLQSISFSALSLSFFFHTQTKQTLSSSPPAPRPYPEAPVTATIVSLLAIVNLSGCSEAEEKKRCRAWCRTEGVAKWLF